jgi:hypothetical protein
MTSRELSDIVKTFLGIRAERPANSFMNTLAAAQVLVFSRSIGGLEISHAHAASNGYNYLDSNQ